MAKFKVRYLVVRKRSDGSRRWFWEPRRAAPESGFKLTRLADDEGRAVCEAQGLNAALDAWRKGEGEAAQPKRASSAATLGELIAHYEASTTFAELRPKTQTGYRWHLARLIAWSGDAPVGAITPRLVAKYYRAIAAHHARAAAADVAVLRLLYSFGRREIEGFPVGLEDNPAREIKLKHRPKRARLWSDPEIRIMAETALGTGQPGIALAIALNAWLGQRKTDVIQWTRDAYKDGVLDFDQSKTGAGVALPVGIVRPLARALEAEIARTAELPVTPTTLIVDDQGRAFDEYRFAKTFRAVREAAVRELASCAELTFRTLRHTAVVRLDEAGCTTGQIRAVTGHREKSVAAIIDTYRLATRKTAESAFRKRLAQEQKP